MLKVKGLGGSSVDSFSNSDNQMPQTVVELRENINTFFQDKSQKVDHLRILGLDPGKNTDPFAGSVIDAYSNKKINIMGAKQWIDDGRTDFYQWVENDIYNIYKNYHVDIIAIERNAPGEPVWEALLHNYQCNVYPVFTTDRKKKTDKLDRPIEKINPNEQYNMDKDDMIYWMIQREEALLNEWVDENTDDDMKELYRQWSIFGEYSKGKFTAPPNDHDDLMMSLLVASFVARKRIIESGGWASFTTSQLDTYDKKFSSLKEELLEEKTGLKWETNR